MDDSQRDDSAPARAEQARRARLAAALRDNLRKRKVQARGKNGNGRTDASADTSATPPAEPSQ